jgi:EAL domain-containing protein (putative c-di-GMP-specific phosphodiesterase class I)
MASKQQPGGVLDRVAPPFPLTMAFQPILDIRDRVVVGHEALVRGPNGEGAAHMLAQVNAENRHAFDQACRVTAIELASRLGVQGNLHINSLPNAAGDPADGIRQAVETAIRTGFPADRIVFEFVEHEEVAELAVIKRIIAEYRRHGFRLALDGFGGGYTGLARLAEPRPDILKVDRFVTHGCGHDPARLAVIGSLVSLGRDLGIDVIVEGVETAADVTALQSVGARFLQGYYFARPAFEALVPNHQIRWPAAGPLQMAC